MSYPALSEASALLPAKGKMFKLSMLCQEVKPSNSLNHLTIKMEGFGRVEAMKK